MERESPLSRCFKKENALGFSNDCNLAFKQNELNSVKIRKKGKIYELKGPRANKIRRHSLWATRTNVALGEGREASPTVSIKRI